MYKCRAKGKKQDTFTRMSKDNAKSQQDIEENLLFN